MVTYGEGRILAKTAEEMGEALQCIGKAIIHGWEAEHEGVQYDNREDLERELGDVIAAIETLAERGVVDLAVIELRAAQKKANLGGWL